MDYFYYEGPIQWIRFEFLYISIFGLPAWNTLNLVYSSILILFAMIVECSASSSEHNFDKKTNSLGYYFVQNLLSTPRPMTDENTISMLFSFIAELP